MYKIVKTTDNKYIGRVVDIDSPKIYFNEDDFIFEILKVTYKKDTIELSNFEYAIEVKLISEIV